MAWQFTSYSLTLFVSAAVATGLIFFAWRWRKSPGGLALILLSAASAIWAATAGLEAAAVPLSTKILWSKIEYIGITSAPVFLLILGLEFAGLGPWLTRRNMVLLWGIPVVSLLLAATNEWHHLIWTSFTPSGAGNNVVLYGHGAWFWVLVAFAHGASLAFVLLLARAVLKYRDVHRHQAALLLVAAFFPWLGNALYAFQLGPFPGQDLTSLGLALAAVLLTLNMRRFQLLDLVPVARHTLVESMRDGVLVLDAKNRVVDANPAMSRLLAIEPLRAGEDAVARLAAWPELVRTCCYRSQSFSEVQLYAQQPRFLSVRVSPIRDERGRSLGQLVILRDITYRKQAEKEREQLLSSLQEALANVKTLRGLVPICAKCKKMRDDEGYWRNVEDYVAAHSEAQFSHGICPECMKDLYPWFKPGEE